MSSLQSFKTWKCWSSVQSLTMFATILAEQQKTAGCDGGK